MEIKNSNKREKYTKRGRNLLVKRTRKKCPFFWSTNIDHLPIKSELHMSKVVQSIFKASPRSSKIPFPKEPLLNSKIQNMNQINFGVIRLHTIELDACMRVCAQVKRTTRARTLTSTKLWESGCLKIQVFSVFSFSVRLNHITFYGYPFELLRTVFFFFVVSMMMVMVTVVVGKTKCRRIHRIIHFIC